MFESSSLLSFLGVCLLSLICGTLVNYLADVLPYSRRLSLPSCVECETPYKWKNYVFFRKCEHCGKKRSLRTWAVLIFSIVSFLLNWRYPANRLSFLEVSLVLVYFGIVAVIDLEHRAILNQVSLAGAFLGLVIGWRSHGLLITLLGGGAGFLIVLLIYFGGVLFEKVMAKKRGQPLEEVAFGFGDVNLGGIIGLILGWPGITAGIILAILIAGLVGIFYLIITKLTRDYKPFTAIPYGPFFILATLFLLFRPF